MQLTYWLRVRLRKIRRQTKAEKAEVHRGDETGLRSDHQSGHSYGRGGRTPRVRYRFSWPKGSAISEVTLDRRRINESKEA